MWRDFALSLYSDCIFSAPASTQQISEAESALSLIMPDELKSLLQETDGILDTWRQGPVLPVDEIKELNLDYRNELGDIYPLFYSRLFIAKGAGGDLWGYKVNDDSSVTDGKIYEWEHELAEEEPEEATYSVKADNLRAFLEWHLTELSII